MKKKILSGVKEYCQCDKKYIYKRNLIRHQLSKKHIDFILLELFNKSMDEIGANIFYNPNYKNERSSLKNYLIMELSYWFPNEVLDYLITIVDSYFSPDDGLLIKDMF